MAATVGELIAMRRKALGLSVGELAAKLGKSRATLYRYETGQVKNIPAGLLLPLAKALETTPDELIGATKNNDEAENFATMQKYAELNPADKEQVGALIDTLHKNSRQTWQPQLTERDRRRVEKDFAAMKLASAAYMDDVKDPAALESAIKEAMLHAKLRAKKLYTPKKYRKS